MLVCNDRRITFSELDINANRLANAYTERGLNVGDRIAMLLPNSAELIEAMCGAAKAGGGALSLACHPMNCPTQWRKPMTRQPTM